MFTRLFFLLTFSISSFAQIGVSEIQDEKTHTRNRVTKDIAEQVLNNQIPGITLSEDYLWIDLLQHPYLDIIKLAFDSARDHLKKSNLSHETESFFFEDSMVEYDGEIFVNNIAWGTDSLIDLTTNLVIQVLVNRQMNILQHGHNHFMGCTYCDANLRNCQFWTSTGYGLCIFSCRTNPYIPIPRIPPPGCLEDCESDLNSGMRVCNYNHDRCFEEHCDEDCDNEDH